MNRIAKVATNNRAIAVAIAATTAAALISKDNNDCNKSITQQHYYQPCFATANKIITVNVKHQKQHY